VSPAALALPPPAPGSPQSVVAVVAVVVCSACSGCAASAAPIVLGVHVNSQNSALFG
jgi:hypothetical protein